MLDDEDLMLAQNEFDKELNDLLLKNQQRLAELYTDMKEVSKVAGEPVVKIRKIKDPVHPITKNPNP